MSFNPPASVLTHGGDTHSGISATVGHNADHHDKQLAATESAAAIPSDIPERHFNTEVATVTNSGEVSKIYPYHMYSIKPIEDTIMYEFIVIHNEAEYKEALASGLWQHNRPATTVVED